RGAVNGVGGPPCARSRAGRPQGMTCRACPACPEPPVLEGAGCPSGLALTARRVPGYRLPPARAVRAGARGGGTEMRGKRTWVGALVLGLLAQTGCCRWCQQHCSPAPAAAAPAPVCCQPCVPCCPTPAAVGAAPTPVPAVTAPAPVTPASRGW